MVWILVLPYPYPFSQCGYGYGYHTDRKIIYPYTQKMDTDKENSDTDKNGYEDGYDDIFKCHGSNSRLNN